MSAHFLIELVNREAEKMLNGDPANGGIGVNQKLLGDGPLPGDYAQYMRNVGWRRGFVDALRLMDECRKQMEGVDAPQA